MVEYKFLLIVYLWGVIIGVVSGLFVYYNDVGWLLGFFLYVLVDKFVMVVVKEFLEDIFELRMIFRKVFWGWFLFWFFFMMMIYIFVMDF